jgi:hypothetical protein
MRMLLQEAKDRFKAIKDVGGDPREFTYVDSEDPEFRGVVKNPLCSFWSEALSKAWKGVDLVELLGGSTRQPSFEIGSVHKVEYDERIGYIPLPDGQYQRDKDGKYFLVTKEMKNRKVKVETKDSYSVYKDPTTGIHWAEGICSDCHQEVTRLKVHGNSRLCPSCLKKQQSRGQLGGTTQ